MQPWKILKSQDIFVADPWIRVSRQQLSLPDGRVVDDYHRIKTSDCAMVFGETMDGRVIVERQYQHGVGKVGLVFPTGAIEAKESPLQAAQRELLEETGYTAPDWQPLGQFVVDGNYRGGLCHMFRARQARQVCEPNSGDLEEIEILLMTPEEIANAVRSGEIGSLGALAMSGMVTNPLLWPDN